MMPIFLFVAGKGKREKGNGEGEKGSLACFSCFRHDEGIKCGCGRKGGSILNHERPLEGEALPSPDY